MAASSSSSSKKGKFFTLSLLLIFQLSLFVNVVVVVVGDESTNTVVTESKSPDNTNDDGGGDGLDLVSKHQLQLEKLEELVKNLTELVSRLESRFSEHPEAKNLDGKKKTVDGSSRGSGIVEKVDFDDGFDEGLVRGERVGPGPGTGSEYGTGPVSVTKYSPFWSERFQFVSAVRLGSNPTCINVLPFKDYEGLSKYVVVGDDRGRFYVFLRNGDVSVEFATLSDSPVTAMLSYLSVYKNESVLVTGHEDGVISMHRLWEVSNGEEVSSLRVENMGKCASPEGTEDGSQITVLEVHYVGRKRYILSADVSGKIRVFREDGTLYGEVTPSSRPLAFLKQRLLFLTETGAGSLDLRTMNIRTAECEGLNNSVAKTYVFDSTERSKAYGFTADGDLIHALLLGDIMNFKCRIRSKKKFEMEEPLAFQAIKGYLLIANQEKVFVYNVSSQNYIRAGGPRLLFSAGFDEIKASFLNNQQVDVNDEKGTLRPLLASNREKLVILNLGSGYVGMYRSNLPLFKNDFNTMLWTSPVLFFILFLFGAWHFFANKKEALTSWGPDDPFTSTSVTSAAPLGSGSGDRSFTDSSRNTDMEMRGNGLGGPSRRYVSPSRYPGVSASPYRPGAADTNSRPASVDPSFRTTSELKFRGSNIDTSGFSKRRENPYMNSQGVDDGS